MKKYLIYAYIAIGIFTFGHIAVNHHCITYSGEERICQSDDRAMYGYPGATLWPLYWSWKIQEKLSQ